MGTEVLRPHDVLGERLRYPPAPFNRRKNRNLASLIVHRKPNNNNNAGHRKTSPRSDKRKSNSDGGSKKPNHGAAAEPRRKDDGGLAMGQVTLLRRGESLDSLTSKINGGNSNPRMKSPRPKPVDDMAVSGTGRIGPDSPEMVLKHIRLATPAPLDMYAGSAFSMSPSPRSVPLPSFFSKKQQIESIISIKPSDDSATRDLRRLLRLD